LNLPAHHRQAEAGVADGVGRGDHRGLIEARRQRPGDLRRRAVAGVVDRWRPRPSRRCRRAAVAPEPASALPRRRPASGAVTAVPVVSKLASVSAVVANFTR
jgi:hypothetical protein